MRLYDQLNQHKKHGEKLDMKQITYDMLFRLWWSEECTDAVIADLYDVPRKKVTNLRHTWGVKTPDIIVQAFEERFSGVIPPAERYSSSETISADAAVLLRKIQDLNDIELETLRLELARRYPAFAGIKQEAEFLAAVERAVSRFGVKNGE